MDNTFWRKQTEALFPDILWSRPESKAGAGKLLIIGGNKHGFGRPGTAYGVALQAGAGVVRVVLPDTIRRIVHALLPDADFAPSNHSGAFSVKALDTMLSAAAWSDVTLFAGDIGRNSETSICVERFLQQTAQPVVLSSDVVDCFVQTPLSIMDRDSTVVVLSLAQLQKLFIHTPTMTPIILSMSSKQLAEALADYTANHSAVIVTWHNGFIFVANDGRVSSTAYDASSWRTETAAYSSVFWMHNPQKPFEAITTAIYTLAQQKD